MALEVILGPPFAGKSQAARSLVEERERAGELGLFVADFTAIFAAVFPGVLSSYRDADVAATGASALTGYLFATAVRQAVARNVSGYVLLNSPRRAVDVAAQVGATEVLEIDIGIDVVADRIDGHLTDLRRRVPRARTSSATAKCGQAATRYYAELPAAAEQIPRRAVRRRGKRYQLAPDRTTGFDEAAFLRGLSPAGHQARADLAGEGLDPTPAAIFRRVLQERMS